MFRKVCTIIFVSIQFLNFIFLTVSLLYALFKWLPRKIETIDFSENYDGLEPEKYRWEQYGNLLIRLCLIPILPTLIATLSVWLDCIGNEAYIGISCLVGPIGGFVIFIALNVYFEMIKKRYKINSDGIMLGSVRGYVAVAIAIMYAVVLWEVTYTIILLFV